MFLVVTGQYRRRCVHIGRAAACALALGCVSGAPFAQADEGQIEKVVFDAGALFDFDAYQLVFIFLDFLIGGVVLFAFVVWVTQARVPLERRAA